MSTLDDLIAGLAAHTKSYVDAAVATATAPLLKRIVELEARAPVPGPAGPAGRDGRDGIDGKDGADGQPGRDGQDGKDGVNGKDGRDGVDGKDGAPGQSGKDGIDGKDDGLGAPGRDGSDGKDGAPGRDGVGVAKSLIDRDGNLVLTLSNGDVATLGQVQGKDGAPGRDGADGRDGLGFDDMAVEYDGERQVTIRFIRGETVKELPLRLPVVLDRGVWRDGAYEKGDGVTFGGSYWICQQDGAIDKPGTGGTGWRLAVKRGRDAREPVKA